MKRLTKEDAWAAMHAGRAAGYEIRSQRPLNEYAQAALDAQLRADIPERRRAGILARLWQLAYYKARDERVAELEKQLELPMVTQFKAGITPTEEPGSVRGWIAIDGDVHERDWRKE